MKNVFVCSTLILLLLACKTHDNSMDVVPKDVVKFTDKLVAEYNIDLNRVDSTDNYIWDWTQSGWDIYFLNIFGETARLGGRVNPFLRSGKYGSLDPSRADMYPKDGWSMIKRDFGNKTSAPIYPYLILYNENRRILRTCIFNSRDDRQSFEEVTLSFKNNDYSKSDTATTGVFEWIVTQFDVSKVDKNLIKPSSINLEVKEYVRYYVQ